MKVLLTILVLVASAFASHPVRIRRIDVTQPEEGHESSIGVVNGVRNCGGPGEIVQWRLEGCSGEGICRLPAEGPNRKSELEFIPSEDINGIGIRLIIIQDDTASEAYDRPVADSAVQGGERYIVNAVGRPSKELKGKTVTSQQIIYRTEDGHVEACAEADFEIY